MILKLMKTKYITKSIQTGIYYLSGVFLALLLLFFSGCQKTWDEHYSASDPAVNKLLWDEIQLNDNFTLFTSYIIENELDTILTSNQQYTLFIPNNEAFESIPDSISINSFLLNHLISPNIFSLRNIEKISKLQTLSGKFALIEKTDSTLYFDGTRITGQSPVYLDGRYYEVENFPFARLSFNEYFQQNLPAIYNYINSQVYDSLDIIQSTPIRIEDGMTIYDSAFITISPFENRYFPISQESRYEFATFVLFNQQQYNSALDLMASRLGETFVSHEDIPLSWQETILFPVFFDNGIFDNALTVQELSDLNLLNILGEEVVLDPGSIDPESKIECSNGYIYEFYDFEVPDSLYMGEIRIEGEDLIDSIGADIYAWKEDVVLTGEIFEPYESSSSQASGNKYLVVSMGPSFTGEFSIEFTFPNIFPRRYRMEWRANYRPSGNYKIFVNDEEVGQYDTYNLRNPLISVGEEIIFRPSSGGFNSVDFWVENINDYGDVKVRFDFIESGAYAVDGFALDYLSLIPTPAQK